MPSTGVSAASASATPKIVDFQRPDDRHAERAARLWPRTRAVAGMTSDGRACWDQRLAPRPCDVAQHIGFALLLVEAVLDEVADADEADELAVFHHRQVADAVRGHQRHDGVE